MPLFCIRTHSTAAFLVARLRREDVTQCSGGPEELAEQPSHGAFTRLGRCLRPKAVLVYVKAPK